ncbi:MAG TPA: VOC family protein [Candidatus Angelobacter sp.]|jgi:catechol 2,3-dioxygenase-like lactoylglutathione lyase family enzyme
MVPIQNLFESHLTVTDLRRSMAFYGELLGLELAQVIDNRKAAFYWIGGRGKSMLGLWEVGTSPQKMALHIAFGVSLEHLLEATKKLTAAHVAPRDFDGNSAEEPVVLAWMPAAAVYFHDPDGNLLEFLTMLPDPPRPELGVVSWSNWKA